MQYVYTTFVFYSCSVKYLSGVIDRFVKIDIENPIGRLTL